MERSNRVIEYSSYIIMAAVIIGVLKLNFLPFALSILLTYLLIEYINNVVIYGKTKWMVQKVIKNGDGDDEHRETKQYTSIIATFSITAIIVGFFTWLTIWSLDFFKVSNVTTMTTNFIYILENLKDNPNVPKFLIQYIPEDVITLKEQAIAIAKDHFMDIGKASKTGVSVLLYMLLGVVVGIMLSFHNLNHKVGGDLLEKPLAFFMQMRISTFVKNFRNVFVAQIKISAIDTVITGIYLLIVLPLFGIDIPFKYLLLLVAFIVGLIPVVGNLISNTLIVVFSLTVSFYVAVVSLAFLVIIHKLEYFLNAKIIGSEINSSAWELILAMLVFERVFGLGGVIAAPIIYAYIKDELTFKKLI